MSWHKDENNIKWMIAGTICSMLLVININIAIWGTDELKKFLLIELFSIGGILVGFYWGSSKGSQDKDKLNQKNKDNEQR